MKKKINIGFTVSESVKMIFDKLAKDKNLSKSELAEQIILSYFDSKKEQILLEKVDEVVVKIDEQLKNLNETSFKNFEKINHKLDIILSSFENFSEEKMVKIFIQKFKEMGD